MIDRNETDGSYALLILPTHRTASAELIACAELAHTTIAALDQGLRATGLYDLAQADLLEKDAQRMGAGNDSALAELVATLDAAFL